MSLEKALPQQENPLRTNLNAVIIDAIQNVKGKQIVELDMRALDDASADYFIVCHGDSPTQVNAIAQRIEKEVRDQMHQYPNHIEGRRNGSWVLVDYFNTIIHIFHRDKRDFYQIEDLWSDAIVTRHEEL